MHAVPCRAAGGIGRGAACGGAVCGAWLLHRRIRARLARRQRPVQKARTHPRCSAASGADSARWRVSQGRAQPRNKRLQRAWLAYIAQPHDATVPHRNGNGRSHATAQRCSCALWQSWRLCSLKPCCSAISAATWHVVCHVPSCVSVGHVSADLRILPQPLTVGCSFGRASDLQPAVLYFNAAARCPRNGAPNPKVGSASDTHYRRKTSALHAQPTARAASAQVSPPLPLSSAQLATEPLRSAAFRPPSLTPACLPAPT